MRGGIGLSDREYRVFEDALRVMAEFSETFGRPLEPSFVAELHVASRLRLKICDEVNRPGYDALDADGRRYQIKYRSVTTANVDVNNFEFDELVLVNLGNDYRLKGMWRMTVDQARTIFVRRDDFRKYQATQKKFKKTAERIA
jgi:hypothetical protein